MTYFLVVYAIGLGTMVLGLLWSRELDNAESEPIGTLVAYLFWPISVVAVACHVGWSRYCDMRGGQLSFRTSSRY